MIEIQASEVPGKIEEILQRVEQGEEFEITRGGKRVARISPERVFHTNKEVIEKLKEYRRKYPLGTVQEIKEWKNQR
ncbi:MAG: type II toxin-antitoxin system Phd/YefM family antitoxin [bacterium]|jgi:prevent-host-death family protein